MSRDYLRFARAVLLWAASTRRITWYLYNYLMRDVTYHEGRVLGCVWKVAFGSFERAQRVAKRSGRHHHELRKAYHCKECGKFHIATDYPERRRLRARRKRERMAEEERSFA